MRPSQSSEHAWPGQPSLSKKRRFRLVAAPNHRYGSREASAHVEGQEFFRALNLPRAGLFGLVLISLIDLTNARRADRMTIADQAAAGVDRDLPIEFAAHLFVPHLRQRRRAAHGELGAFAFFSKTKDFICADFGDREAIVHFD